MIRNRSRRLVAERARLSGLRVDVFRPVINRVVVVWIVGAHNISPFPDGDAGRCDGASVVSMECGVDPAIEVRVFLAERG